MLTNDDTEDHRTQHQDDKEAVKPAKALHKTG